MRAKIVIGIALSAALALPAFAQIPAQSAAPIVQPDQAQLHAVRDMLRVLKFDSWLRNMYQHTPSKAPSSNRELGKSLLEGLSREELEDLFTPVYARHFSETEARAVAKVFATPMGQYYCFTCWSGKRPTLPDTELEKLAELVNTPEAKIYTERSPAYERAVVVLLKAQVAQYFVKMWRTTVEHAAQAAQSMRQAGGEPLMPPGTPSGIPFLDAAGGLMRTAALDQQRLVWQLESDLKALGMPDMISSANLSKAESIARNLNNVPLIDVRIATYLQESHRLVARYHAAMQALGMPEPKAFAASVDKVRERQQSASTAYAAHKHALNELARRLLTAAQARRKATGKQDMPSDKALRGEFNVQQAKESKIATELDLAFTGWPDESYPPALK